MKKLLLSIILPAISCGLALAQDSLKTHQLDTAQVTSTRASDKSPTAFTNVNKQEIEKQNLGKDIPFLLSTTPSVVVTSDAGNGVGYTGLRIRGSDATRVNVTINGIPVNDGEAHLVYWVDLPDLASSVENIQIQRGIGTSTNGAGAFGGSVNILTTSVNKDPYGEVNSSYGSFKTWKNTVNVGTGLHNNFAFDARLSKITSNGYIDRATSDLKSFYLSGGYYENRSSLKAIIFSGVEKTYQAWNGIPGAKLSGNLDSLTTHYYNNLGYLYNTPEDSANLFSSNSHTYNYFTYKNQTDNYQQDYYQLHYTYEASHNLNFNAAFHYTKGKGYYEEYKPQQLLSDYKLDDVVIGGDTITTTDLIRQKWLDNDFNGFTYAANYESDDLQFTLGGSENRYKGRHYDQVTWAQYFSNGIYPHVYNDNNAVKDDRNMFLKAIYSAGPALHILGDLQYRTISYSFLGFVTLSDVAQEKIIMNFFNPKAGITYELNSQSKVFASVAVGHKEPVRDDFVNAAPGSFPQSEQMTDYEAGYKFQNSSFRLNANFYYMNYKNQLILTGRINDVGEYIRENVAESYRTGLELEAGYDFTKNLSLYLTATFSQNKIKAFFEYLDDYDSTAQKVNLYNTTDIAFSPTVTSAGTLSFSPFKNFTADFVGHYVGKQFLDNTMNENRRLKPYMTDDLLLNYQINSSNHQIGLRFGIYNTFNHLYESNGYTYSYIAGGNVITENFFYPQAGIHFMGGLTVKF